MKWLTNIIAKHRAPAASGSGRGVKQQQLVEANARWREQFNPLRGLTIARAVSLLEQAQRGEMADVQWTYRFVEETNPVAFALVSRRISALLEMDFNVLPASPEKIGKAFDEALADEQAAELRAAYDQIDNLYEAIEHLAMASFRSYAHVQPHFSGDGVITHLEPLDQWNFVRDGMYGDWYWNPEARSMQARMLPPANRIDPAAFIIREEKRHIDRVALLQYIRMNLGQKDWDSFVEIYGLPHPTVIMPPNVPAEKLAEYLSFADEVAESGGGALPNGSDVKYPSDTRGTSPFQQYMEFLERQLVLVGTGGLLTMLAESGSGTLAGGAHADTFAAIARGEARKISELFQRSIDRQVLARLFPGKPVMAYFELAAREEQDVGQIVDHAAKLAPAGFLINVDELREKTGYNITYQQPAAPSLPGFGGQAAHRAPSSSSAQVLDTRRFDALLAAGNEQVAQAESAALKRVADRIVDASNAETVEAGLEILKALKEENPALLDSLLAEDSAVAKAYEDTMAAALINGYATASVTRAPAKGDA
jgi:phage gp29-like protein